MSYIKGPSIVKENLIYYVDFSNTKSYDGVSSTGNSLVGDNTISLLNGATFSSAAGGALVTSNPNNIAISSQNIISQSGNNFTWDIWVLRNQSNGSDFDMIMGSYLPYIAFYQNNTLWLRIRISGITETYAYSFTPENDVWYNITLVNSYDSGQNVTTDDIYLNGQYLYSGSASGSVYDYFDPLALGNWRFNTLTDNYCLDGLISSVKIYDRDLSADEVLQNYETVKSKYGH